MNIIKSSLFVALVLLLQSCFDSNDHIFDEADAIDISVETSLARSSITPSTSVKADTFHTGDTIYFLTTITPNKIIRVQEYYWLMDGAYCSSEYNFKKQISEPGHHKFTFVLKDHFGDMHYDSLDVWVSGNPTLNDSAFIPATGTQAIDPYEAIYFTWSASTEGIQLAHHFRFILSEQNFVGTTSNFKTIDTIVYEPNFVFHNKLNPLKKYNWTVQAFNDYNLASEERIESHFYTKGLPGEGSLQATISVSQDAGIPIQAELQSQTDASKKHQFKWNVSNNFNELSFGAIAQGKYNLKIKSSYPEFNEINKTVDIKNGFVTIIDNLKLIDSIKPTISFITGADTLDFADTLRFIVQDKSQTLNSQSISASLESEPILDKFYKDSILTVVLSENEKSWGYRILTISAIDGSKNTQTRSFYIRPSSHWFTTNNDTTISSNQNITFFIRDNNQFGFKVDTLKFVNVTKNETIISIPCSDLNFIVADFEASLFAEEQTIRSIVLYSNGIRQSKDWTLRVNQVKAKEEE